MGQERIDRDGIPARYLSYLFIEELVNFTALCSEKLNLDVTDTLILGCVALFSSNQGLNDVVDRHEATTDISSVDQIQHHAVIAKSIHLKLGMSRETVRRRLVYLEQRGLIRKLDDGYFFPVQNGGDDATGEVRAYCVQAVQRLYAKLSPFLAQQA